MDKVQAYPLTMARVLSQNNRRTP